MLACFNPSALMPKNLLNTGAIDRDRINSESMGTYHTAVDKLHKFECPVKPSIPKSPLVVPSFASKVRMDLSKDISNEESDSVKTARPVPKKMDSSKILGLGRLNLSIDESNQGIQSNVSSNQEINSSSSDLNGMSVSSPRSSSVYSNVNEARNNKVKRYWAKKQNRINQKTVRYNCRQNLARQRYRYQGRFITKEEMEKLAPEQIYDPNLR